MQKAVDSCSIGYIDSATGALTPISVTTSTVGTFNASRPLLLADSKLLFVYSNNGGLWLMECNKDLQVSSIYQPIRTVEHGLTHGRFNIPLETDNYIAVAGNVGGGAGPEIGLYNKTDYSFVRRKRMEAAGQGQLIDAFYSNGQISVISRNGSGISICKLDEELAAETSRALVSCPNLGAPGYLTSQASENGQQAPDAGGYGSDPALGLFGLSLLQRGGSTTVAEMIFFLRDSYGSDATQNYGPYDLLIDSQSTLTWTTGAAPSSTINRTLAFTLGSASPTNSSITISDDINSYQSYILAS